LWPLCIPELLSKFGEAGFARYSSLPDPLGTVERLRLNKKRGPKQHRYNQSMSHIFSPEIVRVFMLVDSIAPLCVPKT
jgi:hypothetical protein